MRIQKLLLTALLPLSVTLSSCSSVDDTSDIKVRTDTMKNWKDAMSIMGGMMKKPDTFDAAQFQEQAAFLAEDAQTPWVHFEDEAILGKATEKVWSDKAGFQQEIDKYQQVTAKLNTAAASATNPTDVSSAFQDVGASCKSCHKEYKISEKR